MRILQTSIFKKVEKKLSANQKICLDKAVNTILTDPLMGTEKIGDLANIRVYKFRILEQLTLLTYIYNQEKKSSIILLALGSHENFYRDLKNQLLVSPTDLL